MTLCCKNCKCDTCGNMYNCEILCERIMQIDKSKCNKCTPIISCSNFTNTKDYDSHTSWKCDIKRLVKAGDL